MCNMDTVLVWVCCKESRCQFLVIQAFRDMPGSHGVRSSRGDDIFDAVRDGNVAAVRHFLRTEPGAATATDDFGGSSAQSAASPRGPTTFPRLHRAALGGGERPRGGLPAAPGGRGPDRGEERLGPGGSADRVSRCGHCAARPRPHPAASRGEVRPHGGGEGAAGGQRLGRGDGQRRPGGLRPDGRRGLRGRRVL